jgi:hypothetical protein
LAIKTNTAYLHSPLRELHVLKSRNLLALLQGSLGKSPELKKNLDEGKILLEQFQKRIRWNQKV